MGQWYRRHTGKLSGIGKVSRSSIESQSALCLPFCVVNSSLPTERQKHSVFQHQCTPFSLPTRYITSNITSNRTAHTFTNEKFDTVR